MSRDRKISWNPRGEPQFIVSSSAQLALYAWDESAASISHVASTADLAGLRCFSWSPTESCDDLVAVGSDSGRVELHRLSLSAPLAANAGNALFPSAPVATFALRNAASGGTSRACNAVAFSSADPNLMACGMDKSKAAQGLVVWDIETELPALGIDVLPAHVTPLPRTSAQKSGDARIVQLHAPTEGVTSLSFLPHSSRLLTAAVNSRWMRLYDLRTAQSVNGTLPRQGLCKSISDVVVDPLDACRIASVGDDTVVRIWDCRNLALPMLTFSEREALGDGARARGGGAAVTGIEFSPSRRGLFASLERDASVVRFWDIVSGESVSAEHNITPDALPKRWRWASSSGDQESLQTSNTEDDRATLHLAETHKSRRFNRPLASFAFVPNQQTKHLVSVSRDGDIEFSVTPDPHLVAWSARGELGIELGRRWRVFQPVLGVDGQPRPWDTPAPTSEPALRINGSSKLPTTFGRGDDDGFPALPPAPHRLAPPRPQAQLYSPASIARIPLERGPGDATPRPSASAPLPEDTTSLHPTRFNAHFASPGRGMKVSHSRKASKSPAPRASSKSRVPSGQKSSVRVVRDDISVVMRRRVLRGYALGPESANFALNAAIAKDDPAGTDSHKLTALWKWMEHSRHLFPPGSSSCNGYDFAFRGVLAIWDGFEPTPVTTVPPPLPAEEQTSLLEALVDGTIQDSPPSMRSMHHQRSEDALDGGYASAVARVNSRRFRPRDLAMEKVMVATAKLEQRRLALAICGWDLDEMGLNDRIMEFEKAGSPTRAACWAMFSNQYAKALEILMVSTDERHRIMSGTLAALLPPNAERKPAKEHYERMIVRLEDPYLRVMMLYAALHDWEEIIREEVLPFDERLAIVLFFFDDRALSSYLRGRAEALRYTADLEGLILTGIATKAGADILDAYVDIAGDVQTAALLTSYVICPPERQRSVDASSDHTRDEERLFERAERWAEAYRTLLDSWRLFDYRCKFDIARGQLLSEALAARGGPAEAPYSWVPGQLRVRCNTCKKLLETGVEARNKGMQCPTCKKPFPRCVICMLALEVPAEDVRASNLGANSTPHDTVDDGFIFCSTCRHGGHARHVLEWFFGSSEGEDGSIAPEAEAHEVCAVGECDCRCADLF
ncbi:WD40 repeat-like protein [Exidia glandulosa HHB12029]|uniref:WD40 repeat-like protein n=1 Tax=Exidia glandulosa HHB12029 TaxID=1314781 RepID=A0A165D398_EXIGL|nr:WD40 repeat-like protein [Exidia glandulosa HHB12029]